eukprot:CAMPEP_0197005352 /NCGR_PEP_ID=MMETSP1380-20130617/28853_1 /TAXON_ID=5936 /ORGANISM="Euplotes crassus, Strain CT5" /LENGTH=272 /DNA_ID=CAMNT_0042424453 /DNA_START=298 /DNA_END=1114 /DNA_ORIENTATION=-
MENLQKVQQEKSKIDAEKDENQEKVLTTKKEELESELAALIEEEKILDEETKQLEEEEAAITVKEQEYWEKENEYEYKLKNHLESNAQMKNQWKSHFSGLTKHYDYLKKLNVLNDVFSINIEGEFGTISGFRLGTLGSKGNEVENEEINGAIGQCILLVSTIALKTEFTFSNIDLKPMGCYSKISYLNEGGKKCTYSFSFYNKTSFNTGMQVFVKAVNLLGQHFQKKFNHIKGKVKLESFKALSLDRFRFNSDHLEEWTNACKELLKVLKWF